jgi:EAL domain-containing protein (putative c-di-GMP-specific phosphodiesterase class I)
VNVTPEELLQPNFLEEFQESCKSFQVPYNLLEFELTESQVVTNWKKTVEILGALRHLGVRVAIDDFGSGYASLDYLIQQSFDTLKLDRGMIQNIPESLTDTQIVRSVVSLCRRIGVTVVAEGVERISQYSFLKRIGCHEAQGFLIGKAMPMDAFRTFVRNGKATKELNNFMKKQRLNIEERKII